MPPQADNKVLIRYGDFFCALRPERFTGHLTNKS